MQFAEINKLFCKKKSVVSFEFLIILWINVVFFINVFQHNLKRHQITPSLSLRDISNIYTKHNKWDKLINMTGQKKRHCISWRNTTMTKTEPVGNAWVFDTCLHNRSVNHPHWQKQLVQMVERTWYHQMFYGPPHMGCAIEYHLQLHIYQIGIRIKNTEWKYQLLWRR